MSRLVLPLDSHDSTSPSRVVSPSSLENSAGVSAASLASRSRNSLGPSLPMNCRRSVVLPGNEAIDAAFVPALPFCTCSSHSGIGSGRANPSSASSVADSSFCACGVAHNTLPCRLTASR